MQTIDSTLRQLEQAPKRLTPDAAAEYLGVAKQTLAKWRCSGKGPAYIKLGSRIRYDLVALDGFLDAKRRLSTSEDPSRG